MWHFSLSPKCLGDHIVQPGLFFPCAFRAVVNLLLVAEQSSQKFGRCMVSYNLQDIFCISIDN